MSAIVRITTEASAATEAVNVWHYRIPEVDDLDEVNEAVVQLDTFYEAIKGLLRAFTWTTGRRVVTVDQTPNRIIFPTVGTVTGTASSAAPAQVSFCLRLTTATVGRSFQGRVYLGPVGDTGILTGGFELTSGAQTTINAAAAALLTPTASGSQLVVYSRKLGTGATVTGVGVNAGLATQRGRLT
jgi:hypothetical protein